jgi:hypothetical protein
LQNIYFFSTAHTWVSLLYEPLIKTLGKLPAAMAVGDPDTGKSAIGDMTLSLMGKNAADVCSCKKTSGYLVIGRFTKTTLPLHVHDLKDSKVIATLMEATSERKAFVDQRNSKEGGAFPSSSVMFFNNFDKLREIQTDPDDDA